MQSTRTEFHGANGHMLAARLDSPDGQIEAYALFAHCFTCGKDVIAASRIARALTDHGIAVLRFDFTGLGGSEGEFANTNFSSNLADLIAAAHYLRTTHTAPALLVGHSLGGAAVLAAAADIPEAQAVVSIAAPSDPAHVTGLFSRQLSEIHGAGEAEVQLGGRSFRIQRQFLQDIAEHTLTAKLEQLHKALLVMHSPQDALVGIGNGMRIFEAARRTKSFISLEGADHLITRKSDALYAANLIATWSAHYIRPENKEVK